MKTIATIAISIIALSLIMIALNSHDNAIEKAAEKYEECVRKEYGLTPAYWYSEHGEYPTCPNIVVN